MHLVHPLEGSISRCAYFPYADVVVFTLDYTSENRAELSSGFRSHYPRGCVLGQVPEMGRIHPGDVMQNISIPNRIVSMPTSSVQFLEFVSPRSHYFLALQRETDNLTRESIPMA